MHLTGQEIRKIRRFLNHTIQTTLADTERLDYDVVQAYRDWVQGVKGITGHDGSFPSNSEQIPAVILEFEKDSGEETEVVLLENTDLDNTAPVINPQPVDAPDELQRLLNEASKVVHPAKTDFIGEVVEIKTDTGFNQ